jgi:hypothetical protein
VPTDDPVTVRVVACGTEALGDGFVLGGALGAPDVGGALTAADGGALPAAGVGDVGGVDAANPSADWASWRPECVLKSSSMTNPATVATNVANARFTAVRRAL